MRDWTQSVKVGAAALALAAAGCSIPGDPVKVTVGPAGGTVAGPAGVKLVVPAGALGADTEITIAADATGAPRQEFTGLSPVFAITPHGTAFTQDARLELPFDPSKLRPGETPMVLEAEPGGRWKMLRYGLTEGTVRAIPVETLSWFVVVACAPGDPCTTQQLTLEYFDPLAPLPQAAPLDPYGIATLETLPISQPTTLHLRATYQGPAASSDWTLTVGTSPRAVLGPPQATSLLSGATTFSVDFSVAIDPATFSGATRPQGEPMTIWADLQGGTVAFLCPYTFVCTVPWDVWAGIRFKIRSYGPTPSIATQPVDTTVAAGQPASFSVAASGPALTYQWRQACGAQAPQAVAGATSAQLSLATVSLGDDGCRYQARVCASGGNPPVTNCVDSAVATLHVTALMAAPVFTAQPASGSVREGQDFTATATATGLPAPTISWFILIADPNGIGADLPYPAGCPGTTGAAGATTASCPWTAVRLSANGTRLFARATNPSGVVESAVATLTVTPAPVVPTVTSQGQLVDQAAVAGNDVTWTVTATGTAPISYTWYQLAGTARFGPRTACPGAQFGPRDVVIDGGTLTLVGVPVDCNGARYGVEVANPAGLALPQPRVATLTVTPPPRAPVITQPLMNATAAENSTVTFATAATGSPPPTYAWTLGGAALPCTTATCAFTPAWTDSGKVVAVTVSNGIQPAATSSALLTVTVLDAPVAITRQPTSQAVAQPAAATFAVGATGAPAPSYQWQEGLPDGGWASLDGGAAATYVTGPTSVSQSGTPYRVVVTNTTRIPPSTTTVNTLASAAATLTVTAAVLPPFALVAQSISAGYQRSMAVDTAGDVWAWGNAVSASTGGYEANSSALFYAMRPVKVAGVSGALAVSTSGLFNPTFYALLADGTVSAWGFNDVGQLGDGTLTNRASPVKVMNGASPLDKVCSLTAAPNLLVLIRSEEVDGACGPGKLKRAWIAGLYAGTVNVGGLALGGTLNGALVQYLPQLPVPTVATPGKSVKSLSATRDANVSPQLLFSLEDGSTFAMGYNYNNDLGAGGSTVIGLTGTWGPVDVSGFWTGVTDLQGGFTFTLGRLGDGTVVGVGRNSEGELALGADAGLPAQRVTLGPLPGVPQATALSACYTTAMAVAGGNLWVWGRGYGFLPGVVQYAVTPPTPATASGGFTAVSLGDTHALALGPGGAVHAFGDPSSGALGNGSSSGGYVTSPTVVTTQ